MHKLELTVMIEVHLLSLAMSPRKTKKVMKITKETVE